MSKKLGGFLLLVGVFAFALYYSNYIQNPILSIQQNINITYNKITDSVKDAFLEHFFQAEHIEKLEAQLEGYDEIKLQNIALAKELDEMKNQLDSDMKIYPETSLIRAISYQKFGNFNRIWLDIKDYDPTLIYGLCYKNMVAGIVVPKNSRALGVLNSDIKSSYSACIGETNAPAVVHGNNTQMLVAEYIPLWYNIKVGDEVVTSGLDKVFFKNLKIGKVVSISKSGGYQSAIVDPYFKDTKPSYFYLIKPL